MSGPAVRKSRFWPLFGTVMVTASVALAVAALLPSDEKDLRSAYDRLDRAMLRRDLPAYMAMLAPDYREQRANDKFKTRQEAEANYRSIMRDWPRFRAANVDLFRVTRRGDEAAVVARRTLSGQLLDVHGAFGPPGKPHDVTSDSMELDIWTKTTFGWQLRTRQMTSLQLTVDGIAMHAGVIMDRHDDR